MSTPNHEPVTLRTRDGDEARAEAEVIRVSAAGRMLRLAVAVGAGLVFGLMLLPVPVLHFVAPWFLPLLGLALGLHLARVTARVGKVEGPCPKCGATVEASGLGAVGAEPVWVRCDGCGAPLELRVPA